MLEKRHFCPFPNILYLGCKKFGAEGAVWEIWANFRQIVALKCNKSRFLAFQRFFPDTSCKMCKSGFLKGLKKISTLKHYICWDFQIFATNDLKLGEEILPTPPISENPGACPHTKFEFGVPGPRGLASPPL